MAKSGAVRPAGAGTVSLRSLPGATTCTAVLTVLTVLLAWLTGNAYAESVLRPAYFVVLWWFFRATGRRYEQIRGLPMTLVESGFLVLGLSFCVAAVIQASKLENDIPLLQYLRVVCERGAIFLLGTSLLAYGIVLWIPHLLESRRVLHQDNVRTHGELEVAETERTRMENKLVDADRLGILGEIAAGVAHDLRNPLAIIKGTVDSLCRKERSAKEVEEHVQVIRRGIEKADRTINSLIDLGRANPPEKKPVRIQDAARDVIGLVAVECRRRKIEIAAAGDARVQAIADAGLLVQTLLNLVLNAVQASKEKGRVVIRWREARFGGASRVALSVDDRGSGLSPEARKNLFTPFFTTKREGTGLGLLSCRRIASDMDGKLGLFPRTSGGTRALLLLPGGPPAPADRSSASRQAAATGAVR